MAAAVEGERSAGAGSFSLARPGRPASTPVSGLLSGRPAGWRHDLWLVDSPPGHRRLTSDQLKVRHGQRFDHGILMLWEVIWSSVQVVIVSPSIGPGYRVFCLKARSGGAAAVEHQEELPHRRGGAVADSRTTGQALSRSGRGQRATGGPADLQSCCSDPSTGQAGNEAIQRSRSRLTHPAARAGRVADHQIRHPDNGSAGNAWSPGASAPAPRLHCASCHGSRPPPSPAHPPSSILPLQAGRPAFWPSLYRCWPMAIRVDSASEALKRRWPSPPRGGRRQTGLAVAVASINGLGLGPAIRRQHPPPGRCLCAFRAAASAGQPGQQRADCGAQLPLGRTA